MKYLITGGAGFIGSNFIHYLFETYPTCEVVNLDKLTYAGNLDNLKDLESNPCYTFVQGDICDAAVVEKAMSGCDIVVHFAAESHVDRSILGPEEFIRTNVYGTFILLEAARKSGIKRFHHVSTDEVYGSLELGSKEKFTEQTKYDPSSPYSASKAASDHLVMAYHRTFGLPVTMSNCSNNYGPFMSPEKFIALSVVNLLQNKKIPIYGDGLNVRDWIHVREHCTGIDLILNKGKLGETYLVGVHGERTNVEVAKMILALLGRDESAIEYVKDRAGHDRRYAIDPSKIEKELGFKKLYNFEDGLRDTIEWYKQNEDWWRPLLKKFADFYEKQYGAKHGV
jgi:dTDP-glucose 4,6-dehydratase